MGMNRFKNAFNEYKKKFQKIEEEVNNNNNNNLATVNIDASSSSSFSSNKINNTMKTNNNDDHTKKKKKRKKIKKNKKQQSKEGHKSNNNNNNNNNQISSLAKLKQRDPSIKYIKNPLQAPKILDAKRFFSKHWHDNKFNIRLKSKTGWRTVAKLSVRGKKPTKHPIIGLFAPKSHRIVRIPNSPAHHVSINKALALVEHCLLQVPAIKGYDGANPGGLSYVAFSVQRKDSKVQLVLVFNNNNIEELGTKNV